MSNVSKTSWETWCGSDVFSDGPISQSSAVFVIEFELIYSHKKMQLDPTKTALT